MIISESNSSNLFLHPFIENDHNTVVVLGGQFGDEGKGKISHYLSRDADIVVRSQGGNNAGHTIVFDNKEFKLHLVPCGILEPHCQCYITGGVVLDPKVMLEEIEGLERQGIVTKDRLWISPSAHVILPYHIALDKMAEEVSSLNPSLR